MITFRWHRATRPQALVYLRAWIVLGLLGCFTLFSQRLPAATATTSQMKTFVLIFRQGSKPLTDEDRKQINPKMPAWAAQLRESGRSLDPRILSDAPSQVVKGRGPDGASPAERPVTALLFIEATDFQDAVRIAQSHPGAAHDITIEVRAWTAPVPPAPPAK